MSERVPGQKPDLSDPYAILGVPRDADAAAIRAAMRAKMKVLHPDVNKTPEAEDEAKMVARAHTLLSDKEKRRAFDAGTIDINENPASPRKRRASPPPPPPRYEPPPPRQSPPPPPPGDDPFERMRKEYEARKPKQEDPIAEMNRRNEEWKKRNEEWARRNGDWAERSRERTEVFSSFSDLQKRFRDWQKQKTLNFADEYGAEGAEKAAEKAERALAFLLAMMDTVDMYRVSNDSSIQSLAESQMRIIGFSDREFFRQLHALHKLQNIYEMFEMHESFLNCRPESREARALLEQTTVSLDRYVSELLVSVRYKKEYGQTEQYLVKKATEASPIQALAERLLVILRKRKKEMWF